MTISYTSLLADLQQRAARSHTSLLSPHAPALRAWLDEHLQRLAGEDGLVGEPVFEHKFGFETHDETLATLAARGEIRPELVAQMDDPPKPFQDEHFRKSWYPYTHQVAAWRAIEAGQSVVVSAGTGAGKTECFAVPILSDLVGQALTRRSTLRGVQALFLYPLNALINSQRERLSAWTRGFGGRVRYCLYNGDTLKTAKASVQRQNPERVMSRKLLWEEPPPLLITNATMLEYMLVRPQDAPILEASQGKLRYIVIDEAHTHVGSMAAELALLLRRVMNAFGVTADQVRFIATSATLASEDAKGEVEAFLADLAGQKRSRVTCITDTRRIPPLPDLPQTPGAPDLEALESADQRARFDTLCGHAAPLAVRRALVEKNGQRLSHLVDAARAAGADLDPAQMVQLLDLGTRALSEDGDAFLPLRGHLFARPLPGIWCCSNPSCAGREGTLQQHGWPYGRLYTSRQTQCSEPGCGATVFELTLCVQCGHEHLLARVTADDDGDLFTPFGFDEIGVAVDERDDAAGDDEDEDDPDGAVLVTPDTVFFDIVPADGTDLFDPRGGIVGDGTCHVRFHERQADVREASCLRCGYRGRHDRPFSRPARTGRSFLLGVATPALLWAMPAAKKGGSLPFDGRRTISFTDSRQGTARFAARSQTTAERSFVRSFVYHELLARSGHPQAIAEKQAALDKLLQAQAQLPDPALIQSAVDDARRALDEAKGPATLTLTQVATRLAETTEFGHLHDYWETYLPFKQKGITRTLLSRWLVLGEFARRPMRAASLETLGLVQVVYDGIDTRRQPPAEWTRLTGELAQQSWADFLSLCLDFYVRSNSALDVENVDDFFRWVGTRITRKTIGGPDREGIRNQRVTWPRAGTNSRLEGLLRRALQLSGNDTATRALINQLFRAAWDRLSQSRELFQPMPNGGLAIRSTAMQLRLVDDAHLCPITGTLLSTTLLGHSPYAPTHRELDTRTTPVRMPRAPHPWGWRFMPLQEIRAALAADPVYQHARTVGALSEFTDRIFEGVVYWQTAEHSAQIPSRALQAAERDFKRGRLNLLSCSTTMEMGVDIGNLSGVSMNNVPPSPANFLQRVGRAGRRGETASVSLTLCRQMPHDQAVFADPDWPFRTEMHVTPVRLDSRPIVERHVRAAVLTAFLSHQAPTDAAYRLTCRWFLVSDLDDEPTNCERLCAWLTTDEAVEELHDDLERLVAGSALDGRSIGDILQAMVPPFQALEDEFARVRDGLLAEIARLPPDEREDSPAALLFLRQIARHEQEYLLAYLADQQVLPGYGFPTGVVPFVHTTREEADALKRDHEAHKGRKRRGDSVDEEAEKRRIDSRARLSGLASRDLPMALREYAPGSTLVLDRRSYTSKGVRLAWKIPPSATASDVSEVQALRRAWRCRACGATGSSQVTERPENCPSCGAELREQVEFLVPSGFTTDFHDEARMDDTGSVYVPVLAPWISSGQGPFREIGAQTPLVRWRHTPSGEMIHHSAGAHNFGYALCLQCGRAEPETGQPAGELPNSMKDHRRLRSGKPCDGGKEGSFSVKRNLRLGGSLRTDVLELWLIDPTTGRPAGDRTLLTTIAVALRQVAARRLGVDQRELGFATSGRRQDGQSFRAILLYDTATGGAGFVAQIPKDLPSLLRDAAALCHECPRECDQVCHACLLSSDTQHHIEHLDRHSVERDGIGVLSARFLDALEPDLTGGVFGAESRAVWIDPVDRVLAEARRCALEGAGVVSLYAGGSTEHWDLVAWRGREVIQRLRALPDHLVVRMVLDRSMLDGLTWHQTNQLAALTSLFGVSLEVVAELPRWWADVRGATGPATGWATDEPVALDAAWPGLGTHQTGPCAPPPGDAVDLDSMRKPAPPRTREIDLSSAASGTIRDLAEHLFAAFNAGSGLFEELYQKGAATRVEVHDRYLRSPLVVGALYRVLLDLQRRGVVGKETAVTVHTLEGKNDKGPHEVGHDWAYAAIHREVIELLFGAVHNDVKLVTRPWPYQLQHARAIQLHWPDEHIELRLDQGFGFLSSRGTPFPFARNATAQVTAIMNARWPLTPKHPGPVPGYVVRSDS